MMKKSFALLVALFVLGGCSLALATTWVQDGQMLNLDPTYDAYAPKIAFNNGVPYVAWTEWNDQSEPSKVYVKHLNGSAWVQDGGALNIDTALFADGPAICIFNNKPYVAWYEGVHNVAQSQIFVKHWSGSSWDQDGNSLNVNAAGIACAANFAVFNSTLYVAWQDGNAGNGTKFRIYVKHLNGTNWIQDGGVINMNAGVHAHTPSLSASNSLLHLAWEEAGQIYVKRLNGTAWEQVGSTSLNMNSAMGASAPKLSVYNGTPYVAWSESNGTASQVYMKHWNGTAWVSDGGSLNVNTGINGGPVNLSVYFGTPYVSWPESNNGSTFSVYVKRWSGSNWILEGSLFNVTAYQQNPVNDMAISKGHIFLPCLNLGYMDQINVMEGVGSRVSWTNPKYSYPASNQPITVLGANFNGTPVCKLQRSGSPDITSSATVKNSSTSYTYTFDLHQATPGAYDLQVVGADNNISGLKQAFSLLTAIPGPVAWSSHDLGQAGSKTTITLPCDLLIGDAVSGGLHQQGVYAANQDNSLFEYLKTGNDWTCTAQSVSNSMKFGKVVLADGNGDQSWEVYAGTSDSNHLFSCSSDWQTADMGTGNAAATMMSAVAGADLHHDGITRIYAAGTDGAVLGGVSEYEFNDNGWTIADVPGSPARQAFNMTTGDGTNSGDVQLYSANDDACVYQYLWNGFAFQVSVVGTGTDIMYGVAVGDGANLGNNQIYAACRNGKLHQFRWNGSAWSNQVVGQAGGNTLYAVAVSDGENNGTRQVYAACGDGHVYEFKCQSGTWSKIDLGSAGTPLFALAVGDADNDHHFEVYALGQNNHVYQFKAATQGPSTPTATPTQVLAATATPTVTPEPLPQNYFKIYHNQINPNQGEQARIVWTQGQSGAVTITLYNLLGDKIAALLENRTCPTGQYNEADWDGKNQNGHVVGSGIYLAVLQVNGRKQTGKIAVVK